MAKKCDICWKAPRSWNKRSFSNSAVKRFFRPNIQKKKIQINWFITEIKVCTRCLKRLQKEGIL